MYATLRVSFNAQILNGIKIIKLYCWEKPFQAVVNIVGF